MPRKRRSKAKEPEPIPVTLDIYHRTPDGKEVYTPMAWPPPTPKDVTLTEFMESYCDALAAGGACAYVSDWLGYKPIPYRAELRMLAQVIETWEAKQR